MYSTPWLNFNLGNNIFNLQFNTIFFMTFQLQQNWIHTTNVSKKMICYWLEAIWQKLSFRNCTYAWSHSRLWWCLLLYSRLYIIIQAQHSFVFHHSAMMWYISVTFTVPPLKINIVICIFGTTIPYRKKKKMLSRIEGYKYTEICPCPYSVADLIWEPQKRDTHGSINVFPL